MRTARTKRWRHERGTRQDKSVSGCDDEEVPSEQGQTMNPTSLSNLGDLKPEFKVDVDVHIYALRVGPMCTQEKKRVIVTRHEDRKDMKEKKEKKPAGGNEKGTK